MFIIAIIFPERKLKRNLRRAGTAVDTDRAKGKRKSQAANHFSSDEMLSYSLLPFDFCLIRVYLR
jgi:hypothetical protein